MSGTRIDGTTPMDAAERKGLPYQTYIKSLLHETLAEREKRKVGWQTTLDGAKRRRYVG